MKKIFCLVAMRAGEIPVPIPNTTVKPCTADGTILATVWKNRRLPDLNKKDRRWPAMRDQERRQDLRQFRVSDDWPEGRPEDSQEAMPPTGHQVP